MGNGLIRYRFTNNALVSDVVDGRGLATGLALLAQEDAEDTTANGLITALSVCVTDEEELPVIAVITPGATPELDRELAVNAVLDTALANVKSLDDDEIRAAIAGVDLTVDEEVDAATANGLTIEPSV